MSHIKKNIIVDHKISNNINEIRESQGGSMKACCLLRYDAKKLGTYV